ncbi:kinesin-domain-containing protein [Rhizopus microsporus]|uniref:Kinesin-like protein n=1 Tax=Rhizopus microsporus TaxID=58291 RepID=A0A1X0S8D9_RHIZD|nr:kinesin-domain-containing protein [Rhizopus microsporus]
MTTSTSTMTSGLRQPQTYSNSSNSRLPQPDSISRTRRQSIIDKPTPPPSIMTANVGERHIRSRTMSDAPRPDLQQLRSPLKDRRLDLRKSLLLDQPDDQDSEEELETKNRKYRSSAPLLDAYGVPLSPAKAAASLRSSTAQQQNTAFNLPQSDLNQKIRVCVRKRPLNRKELEKGDKDVAPTLGTRSLQINEPKLRLDLTKYTEQHTFTFDDVFDSNVSNAVVYERTALPLVNYIFKGGKATCFAYGQTGSGKTYTMLDPRRGLYILAARDIFSMLNRPENQHLTAWIGLYEIYQGQLYDLLNNRKKLFAREDGKNNVIISGLKEYPIDNVDKLIQVFDYGNSVRTTGTTGANDTSSRSHAVLQILLKHKENRKKIHGKLSFIDLAGSERGADRGEADTKTRMEGAEINKSLLALKECIRALDKDKRHTPFRQSKLTQVLKDSFVGHSRTCMVATISPGGSNSEHTLNTLRYADRVKELKGEREKRTSAERNYNSVQEEEVYEDDDEEYIEDDLNDDEYFSNESDILDDDTFNEESLFDVDFPHEQDSLLQSSAANTLSLSQQSQTRSDSSDAYIKSSSQSKPHSMIYRSNTQYDNPSQQRPLSLQAKHQSLNLPRSYSMYSRNSTDTASDTSSTYSSPQRSLLSSNTAATMTATPVGDGVPSFSNDRIEEFIKFHRGEIREITDCTKRETKLVAHMSLHLSSHQDDDNNSSSSSHSNHTKNTSEFLKYLQDLDEILEHKLAAIEALRDRISDTVGQIEF